MFADITPTCLDEDDFLVQLFCQTGENLRVLKPEEQFGFSNSVVIDVAALQDSLTFVQIW